MRIVDAMTLRDGGTTCVTLEDERNTTHVSVDHALRRLTWAPIPRFVFTSSTRFGRDRRLLPGGKIERYYVSQIARAAVGHLGYHEVRELIRSRVQDPGLGQWFYVLNFLQILSRARLRDVLASAKP